MGTGVLASSAINNEDGRHARAHLPLAHGGRGPRSTTSVAGPLRTEELPPSEARRSSYEVALISPRHDGMRTPRPSWRTGGLRCARARHRSGERIHAGCLSPSLRAPVSMPRHRALGVAQKDRRCSSTSPRFARRRLRKPRRSRQPPSQARPPPNNPSGLHHHNAAAPPKSTRQANPRGGGLAFHVRAGEQGECHQTPSQTPWEPTIPR